MSSWFPLIALTAWMYAEEIETWLERAVNSLGFMLLGYYLVATELLRSAARIVRFAS